MMVRHPSNELDVCSLCYHPSEHSITLLCRHGVCKLCVDKLSRIAPPALAGKVFCPICSCFVGRQVSTVSTATQTLEIISLPSTPKSRPSSPMCSDCGSCSMGRRVLSIDSGYESIEQSHSERSSQSEALLQEEPCLTSTPYVRSSHSRLLIPPPEGSADLSDTADYFKPSYLQSFASETNNLCEDSSAPEARFNDIPTFPKVCTDSQHSKPLNTSNCSTRSTCHKDTAQTYLEDSINDDLIGRCSMITNDRCDKVNHVTATSVFDTCNISEDSSSDNMADVSDMLSRVGHWSEYMSTSRENRMSDKQTIQDRMTLLQNGIPQRSSTSDKNLTRKTTKKAKMAKTAPKRKCSEHPHCMAKLYCFDCELLICLACRISKHKGHSIGELKDMDPDMLDSVLNPEQRQIPQAEPDVFSDTVFPESMEDHVLELKTWLEDLQKYIEILEKKKKFALKQLTVRRDYLRLFVERWFGKMTLKVETVFEKEISGMQNICQDIQDNIEQYENKSTLTSSLSDVLLKPVTPECLSSLQDHLSVVLSFGIGLTYNMLGTFSACHLTSNSEEPEPCPVSNFEESFSADTLPVDSFHESSLTVSNTFSHTSAVSSLPSLRYLPKPNIHIISRGQELRCFETRPSDDPSAYMATGLCLMKSGNVLVADIGNDSVKVFSTAGRFLFDINTLPDDQATKAVELINGQIAVATKSSIKLYTSEGYYRCKATRAIESPQGLASAPNGNILVSDNVNDINAIVTFRPDLQTQVHVFNSSSHKDKSKTFVKPWYIATNSRNDIFVSDREDHCVKVFSRRGKFKWSAGGQGAAPGQLFHPAGIAIDKFGNVLVADCGNSRIQLFSGSGEWMGIITDSDDIGLDSPTDLAIDPRTGHLVVLQADGKVRRFKYMV